MLSPVEFDEAAQEGAGEEFQLRDLVHAAQRAASSLGPHVAFMVAPRRNACISS